MSSAATTPPGVTPADIAGAPQVGVRMQDAALWLQSQDQTWEDVECALLEQNARCSPGEIGLQPGVDFADSATTSDPLYLRTSTPPSPHGDVFSTSFAVHTLRAQGVSRIPGATDSAIAAACAVTDPDRDDGCVQ